MVSCPGVSRFGGFLRLAALLLAAFSLSAAAAAPHRLEGTPIAVLAAGLAPGEFALLESALPPGYKRFYDLLRVRLDDGRGIEIDGWTDSAAWDPGRARSYFIGERQYKKFISYDALANTWRELGWDGEPPPKFEQYGHTYGRTALDARRGDYYLLSGANLYRYHIDAARWSALGEVPIRGFLSMAWHEKLDKLVAVSPGHQVHAFRDGEWVVLGQSAVHGYHSLGRYNRKRGDMLVAGGNESLRKVDLIDGQGHIRAMPDAPFDISIKDTALTYDPVGGNYLILRRNTRQLYELDPDRREWRLAADWNAGGWPFGQYGYHVPIVIDELGVILWQHEGGPRLYRHRSAFAGGGAPAAAEGKARTTRHDGDGTPAGLPTPESFALPDPQPYALPEPQPYALPGMKQGEAAARVEAPAAVREDEASSGRAQAARQSGQRADTKAVKGAEAAPPPGAGPLARGAPPSPPVAPARLAALIRQMKAGEWKTVPTTLPEGYAKLADVFFVRFCPLDSGQGTYGNGWMDAFVYDPATQAFFAMLMRDKSEKRLIWLDAELRWHVARNPEGVGDCSYNRRAFNRLSIVDGQLYWPPAFWGAERKRVGEFRRASTREFVERGDARFEPYGVGIGITSLGQAGDHAAEWFPELGGWIMHVAGSDTRNPDDPHWPARGGHTEQGAAEGKIFMGRLFLHHPGDTGWTYLDRTYGQGFRGRLVYNPIRHEMLVAPGGYGPDDEFARIGADGKVEKLDRARLASGEALHYHTSNNNLTYDPVSGDYLWWSYNHQRIWRSKDGRVWTEYENFAGLRFNGEGGMFGASSFIQVAPVPGTDGLAWFDPNRGLILHRMRR